RARAPGVSYAQPARASGERAGRLAPGVSPPGLPCTARRAASLPPTHRLGRVRWGAVVRRASPTGRSGGLGHWLQGRVVRLPVVLCRVAMPVLCAGQEHGCLGWSPRAGGGAVGEPALLARHRGLWVGPAGQADGGGGARGGLAPGGLGLAPAGGAQAAGV